ncbi:MAG: hypothetical protein ACP5U0_06925 [Caldisphaera sp.]
MKSIFRCLPHPETKSEIDSSILVTPILRFGNNLNSITVLSIEIYSRINKLDFRFILNVDKETFENSDDDHFKNLIEDMDLSYAYYGKNPIKFIMYFFNTLNEAKKC